MIMCAAVSDFKVKKPFGKKIKHKEALSLKLVPNKDLIAELAKEKQDKLLVGFSLETEHLVKRSIDKLKSKNLDLIVANKLTQRRNIFGDNKLDVVIIDKAGNRVLIKNKNKAYIAGVLLDKIEDLWYLNEAMAYGTHKAA